MAQKIWDYQGVRHRDNGPAYIGNNGHAEWWEHGVLKRIECHQDVEEVCHYCFS